MKEFECPELIKKRAGDEIYYRCGLNGKTCLKEYGYECEEYESIRAEQEIEQQGIDPEYEAMIADLTPSIKENI